MATSGEIGWKAELMDSEWIMSNERKPLAGPKDAVNSSMWESVGASIAQGFDESIQNIAFAIHLNIHARGCVTHPAIEIQPNGKIVNKRSEADALNDTANVNSRALI